MSAVYRLLLQTRYATFPNRLIRELALEREFSTAKELEDFIAKEEFLCRVADTLPDEWRVANPRERRENALKYVRAMGLTMDKPVS